MKAAFTTLFAALAAALPQNTPNPDAYENIDIADFTVRKNEPEGTISAVSFKLSGDDAKDLLCEASDPSFPTDVITCGETKYRFALFPSENQDEGYEFNLRLYHELGPAYVYHSSYRLLKDKSTNLSFSEQLRLLRRG
jgi:hypothetical protein